MNKYSLAFDFGATSFRAILGKVEGDHFVTKEVMRKEHDRVLEDGRSCWQWNMMLTAIVDTIEEHKDEINSIAFNTWGVDCGLLDKDGKLLHTPISYRDPRNDEGFTYATKTLSAEDIFMLTGNQIMSINTLFQLMVFKKDSEDAALISDPRSQLFSKIDKVLMMPDLFGYMLTGNKFNELTIASTSQLLKLDTAEFSPEILKTFALKESLFSNIVMPGTIVGSTKDSKIERLAKLKLDIPVIAVASHDTASAVMLTEAYTSRDIAFLSCGTWSLIGALSDKPIITKEAYAHDLTNESGYEGTNMFFKNITGLYILETFKKQLEAERGSKIDFAEITSYVEKSQLDLSFDVDDPVFSKNRFDVRKEIDALIGKSLEHDFDYFKVIYLSLALKYKSTLEHIASILKRKFSALHMIGGGAKSEYLCKLVADTLKMEVIAGPMEATAYGNLIAQKLALKELPDLETARKFIIKNETFRHYSPRT